MRVRMTFANGRTKDGYLPLYFPLSYMEEYMIASGAESVEILSVRR